MKKRFWKFLVHGLCLALLLGLLPGQISAAGQTPPTVPADAEIVAQGTIPTTEMTWVLTDDGTMTISGTGVMPLFDDCVPLPWTSHKAAIRTVVVEDGAENLGQMSFMGCANLEQVWLPDSMTAIDMKAFYECTALTTIRMPAHLVSIGRDAFYRCIKLRGVELGDSLVSIKRNAFDCCYELTRLVFPATMAELGPHAFRSCTGLTELWFMGEVPDSVSSYAFDCTATCYYPEWATSWKNGLPGGNRLTYVSHNQTADQEPPAFSGECGDDLRWQLDEQGVLVITGTGEMWDYSMANLPDWRYQDVNTVVLTEGVTSVGSNAFDSCWMLGNVVFPEGLARIGEYAFANTDLENITLPEGLVTIEKGAFNSCGVRSLVLPDSVTEVGERAFADCTELETAILSDALTTIGTEAFSQCKALLEIVLPDSVTSLGDAVFSYCESLTSAVLGAGITTIPKDAFRSNYELAEVTISGPVHTIYDYAFHSCQALAEIRLPDTLTTLGTNAFSYCMALEEIVLPDSVSRIGTSLFAGCESLSSVTLGEGITALSEEMFAYCDSLTAIDLPASVQYLNYAFPYCDNLAEVRVHPDSSCLLSIDGVIYTRDLRELVYCPTVKTGSLLVPFTVSSIRDYALAGCAGLTGVDLANVERIGQYAFYECSGLREIVFPRTLDYIATRAFLDCESLRSVICYGEEPNMAWDAMEGVKAVFSYPDDEAVHTHSFREEYVPRTDCEKPDQYVYSCECGEQYAVSSGEADEHWFSGWWMDSNGLTESQYCVICQKTWSRPVGGEAGPHSHSYTAVVTAPTCDHQGYTTYRCSCGDEYLRDFVPALAHSYGPWTAEQGDIGIRCCDGCGRKQYGYISGSCGTDARWRLEGDTLYISGSQQAAGAEFQRLHFTHAVVEEGITGLGEQLFYNCRELKTVTIPASVTQIHSSAFQSCLALEQFHVAADSAHYCDVNGVLYSADGQTLVRFPAGREGVAALSGTVTEIAPAAFEDCVRLSQVLFAPEGLTTIGAGAFRGCSALTRITLPETLTTVGELAFADCTSLQLLFFRGDVPQFGEDAFQSMSFIHYTYPESYNNNWRRFNNQFNNWTGTLGAYNVTFSTHTCVSHQYEFDTQAPSCRADGFTIRHCTLCDISYADEFEPSSGAHNYVEETIAPTCTTPGSTVLICTGCGDRDITGETAPLGHDFGEWTVTKEATEESDGEEQRSCSRCDETESRSIPKQAHTHDYEAMVTGPDCTEPGFTTYRCACGDSYISEETAALGHDFESGICKRCGEAEPEGNPFTDVPAGVWYSEPVLWAVEQGITTGTSTTTFGPNDPCIRAQVVTFLWRAMGKPEPEKSDNPFTDVPEGAYYYKAVLWAVEKGITSGMTPTTFGPNEPCTRAQVVTFLWRAVEQPEPEQTENPFTDVAEGWFYKPVLWAVEKGVTSGMSPDTFAPNGPCTRAQVVTFLHRALKDR